MWYHGTTHDFDSFSLDNCCESNFVGSGVYLTNCHYDASENYASIGPDLEHRLDELYYDLSENDDRFIDSTPIEIWGEVFNILHGKKSLLLTCETDCKPLILDYDEPFYFNAYTLDEEEDLYEYTEEGEKIAAVLDCFDLDFESLELDFEFSAIELFESLRKSDDPEWTLIFNQILFELGYDSVLFKNFGKFCFMYKNWVVDHLIVFDPSKVNITQKEDVGFDESEIENFIQARL